MELSKIDAALRQFLSYLKIHEIFGSPKLYYTESTYIYFTLLGSKFHHTLNFTSYFLLQSNIFLNSFWELVIFTRLKMNFRCCECDSGYIRFRLRIVHGVHVLEN